ncbi:hypothetical protein ES319_A12G091900v1, partial [Gossypium barbadense]
RVDLGGQSSKERVRQKLLKQTRLERNRCLWLCQQNSAALKIQKYFRRGKVVEVERAKVREQFYKTYGKHGHHVDRHCFGPDLEFLRQLIFFVNAWNMNDISVLAEICRLIQHFVRESGDVVELFAGTNYLSNHSLVVYRLNDSHLLAFRLYITTAISVGNIVGQQTELLYTKSVKAMMSYMKQGKC